MTIEATPDEAFRHFFRNWYQGNKSSLSRSEQQNIWRMHRNLGVPKKSPSIEWIRATLERYAPGVYEFKTTVIIHD